MVQGIVAAVLTCRVSNIPAPPCTLFSLETSLNNLPIIIGFSIAFSSKATKTTSPVKRFPNKLALVDEHRNMTFQELRIERVCHL